jgi:hypothetical protein
MPAFREFKLSDVASVGHQDGIGYGITNQHDAPLLWITYRTGAEAEKARPTTETALHDATERLPFRATSLSGSGPVFGSVRIIE